MLSNTYSSLCILLTSKFNWVVLGEYRGGDISFCLQKQIKGCLLYAKSVPNLIIFSDLLLFHCSFLFFRFASILSFLQFRIFRFVNFANFVFLQISRKWSFSALFAGRLTHNLSHVKLSVCQSWNRLFLLTGKYLDHNFHLSQ